MSQSLFLSFTTFNKCYIFKKSIVSLNLHDKSQTEIHNKNISKNWYKDRQIRKEASYHVYRWHRTNAVNIDVNINYSGFYCGENTCMLVNILCQKALLNFLWVTHWQLKSRWKSGGFFFGTCMAVTILKWWRILTVSKFNCKKNRIFIHCKLPVIDDYDTLKVCLADYTTEKT